MKCWPHMTKGVWQVFPIDSGRLRDTPPKFGFIFWADDFFTWDVEFWRSKERAVVESGRRQYLLGGTVPWWDLDRLKRPVEKIGYAAIEKKSYPAVDLDLAIEILLFQEELMDFSSSYVGLMEAYTSLMGCIVSSLCMEIWKERPWKPLSNRNTIVRTYHPYSGKKCQFTSLESSIIRSSFFRAFHIYLGLWDKQLCQTTKERSGLGGFECLQWSSFC